jgi:hypothetical protein
MPAHTARWRALRTGSLAALALSLLVVRPAGAHPLHTTLTELRADRARGVVRVVIRVFADDFGTAAGRDPSAYLQRAFVLRDGPRPVHLHQCGTRRSGGLLWICMEGPAPAITANLTLTDALLCELFDDQVNIVRATLDGSTRSVLFTAGDRAKSLR